ncbi:hypothetical protein AVEN_122769-1 [Araneus ventricosus]|uniref:Integrase zinc-binding domain-containing protein n=1 Tax=Araneus ventricosus TaxID=182803 RepID=A0A4Y2U8K8_ARAVE|nr:hypothetical protein AVEN_122769-1 [Araneus ventricosus]
MLTNLQALDLPESEKHNFEIMSVCEHDNSKTMRATGLKFGLWSLNIIYIRHINGKDNVVVDALSRIEGISTSPLAYEDTARSPRDDGELDLSLKQPTSLVLQKFQGPNTDVMLYSDVPTQVIRPYIPKTHRYQVFRNLHDLAHAKVRATVRLICSLFIWLKMKQDIVNFTRSCIACQKSKITRHVH